MKNGGKQQYLISPYLCQLTILGMCGILLCTALIIFFLYDQGQYSVVEFLRERWLSLVLPLGSPVVYFLVCINNAYEYFGYVLITDSELICYAPFRKPLVYKYSEIQEIGIDYVWLSVSKQFWIYVGIDKMPNKYCHRINRLPINQSFVRVQFSENVFNALLKRLPHDLQKKLYRSKTMEVSINTKGTH